MSIVYINSVRLDNLLKLVYERLSRSLYTQHPVDLYHIVAIRLLAVNLKMRKTLFQVGAIRLENHILIVLLVLFIYLLFMVNCIDVPFCCLYSFDSLYPANEDAPDLLLNLH